MEDEYQGNMKNSKVIRELKHSVIFVFIVVLTCTGCASAKKNKFHSKWKESLCNVSHLGKNKYYYSKHYQRKLKRITNEIAIK